MSENSEWAWKLPYELRSILKYARVIYFRFYNFLLCHLFKTYLIYDCARCEDCGRNVHDFIVPSKLWIAVYGSERGILCYDCFCDRADRKFHYKWRMSLTERWRTRRKDVTEIDVVRQY